MAKLRVLPFKLKLHTNFLPGLFIQRSHVQDKIFGHMCWNCVLWKPAHTMMQDVIGLDEFLDHLYSTTASVTSR